MRVSLVCIWISLLVLPNAALAKKTFTDKYGVNLLKADKVYTSVNLHPDNERGVLYTINYQLPSLMPRCTEVEIIKFNKKRLKFRVAESGREYEFAQHKRTKYMPLNEILVDFFASKCGESDLAGLSKKDLEGIKKGVPSVGMTKEGILLAMGRPPIHVNPSLDANEWMYWRNKFGKQAITFDDNGVVTSIR